MGRVKPQFINLKLSKIHPTQMTVGKLEIARKRKSWREMNNKDRHKSLSNHWFPGVIGPNGTHYIVDHHHFGLALIEEDVQNICFMILKDLSWLDHKTFWNVMDHYQYVHPYNNEGIRCEYDNIPNNLTLLADDPYRSLAGELRHIGGYAKDAAAYSEFLWADYFRNKIDKNKINSDFKEALEEAFILANTEDAKYLPGWVGSEKKRKELF